MKTTDFDIYSRILFNRSGLAITTDKSYLIEARLAPVIKKWQIADMNTLTNMLRSSPDPKLVEEIVDAMTTNETMFFRDQKPFDKFRDIVMPALIKEKGPGCKIRIWSAACSSGQEPYTLGIMIKENMAKWPGVKFEILATDLSKDILETAKAATYSQFEVQRGMPINLLVKYLTQNGDKWTVNDEIRNMVQFENFNLLEPMTKFGTFDIIYCRNVLIYFDQETKAKVLSNLVQRMPKYGYLFLGGAETVWGITDVFKPMEGERGLYIPATHGT